MINKDLIDKLYTIFMVTSFFSGFVSTLVNIAYCILYNFFKNDCLTYPSLIFFGIFLINVMVWICLLMYQELPDMLKKLRRR